MSVTRGQPEFVADAPLYAWADALTESLRAGFGERVATAVVFASTTSTQDAAARMLPQGLVGVLATDRQTAGRGRPGKRWQDDAGPDGRGLGLAMTLALPDACVAGEGEAGDGWAGIALASGVATAWAIESVVGTQRVGLKWPNDVLELATDAKIAGVLIERAPAGWLVGVGINVHHRSEELVSIPGRCSLAAMGARCDRLAIMCGWLGAMARAMALSRSDLLEAWRRHDCLSGRRAVVRSGGHVHEGLIESIDPSMVLVVRTKGGLVRLPAATSTVERIEPINAPRSRR